MDVASTLSTFSKLDAGFYVFNIAWLLVSCIFFFLATAELYEAKKMTMGIFIMGPLFIIMSGLIPVTVFYLYGMRFHFAVDFVLVCMFCIALVWVIPFLLGRWWQVSGRMARAELNRKTYSPEVESARRQTWPFTFLGDWESLEEEVQRQKAKGMDNSRR